VAYVSDRLDRRRLIVVGQAVLAMALVMAACTRSAAELALALTFAGAASGIACNAAQAQLVEGNPARADRAMVRWTLLSCVGDVLAPVVTATAVALGFSYRGAMAVVGGLIAVQCVITAIFGEPPPRAPGRTIDSAPSTRREPLQGGGLTVAPPKGGVAARRAVWAWLFAAASCTLLDEIIVALAALRMEREQGAAEAVATAAVAAFSLGTVLGSAWAERAVDRWGARVILAVSAVGCMVALSACFATGGILAATLALFAVGVACAPHHGLALAQAYKMAPESPGSVQALAQVFVVIDVLAPLAMGLAADRLGPGRAILLLAIQPAVILACAAWAGEGEVPTGSG
jgi:MFS family permease